MSFVYATPESSGLSVPETTRARHSPLTPEKVNALTDNLSSGSAGQVALALDHLVFLTDDPENSRTICSHARRDEILTSCITALTAWVGSQADALGSLVSMLVVPDVAQTLWTALASWSEKADSSKLIIAHELMPQLMPQLLNGIDATGSGEYGVLIAHKFSFLRNLMAKASQTNRKALVDYLVTTGSNVKLVRGVVMSWKVVPGRDHHTRCIMIAAMLSLGSQNIEDLAVDMVSILREGLALQGAEGEAARAFGNFMTSPMNQKSVLEHAELVASCFTDLGFFLRRTKPCRASRMAIFAVWRLVADPKGMNLLSKHHHAALVCSGVIKCLGGALEEDPEALTLLGALLQHPVAKRFVLAGDHVELLLTGCCALFAHKNEALDAKCCALLDTLVAATELSVLMAAQEAAPGLVAGLSRCVKGRPLLGKLTSLLQWQPRLVQAISLEYKREWISEQIRRTGGPREGCLHVVVHRDQLLADTCAQLAKPAEALRHGIDVRFTGNGENGVGDGHRREFFRLIADELVNPNFGLFRSNDGGRSFHVSCTSSHAQPDHLAHFELCGKLVGLALLHRETLPAARFTPALLKLLLGSMPLELEDMAVVDPAFYNGKVLYLLEDRGRDETSPVALADLEMTFEDAPQPDVFPDLKQELCPGGGKMAVTEENVQHYCELLCDHRLRGSVHAQLEALLRGFHAVCPEEVAHRMQRMVCSTELGLLICGLEDLSCEEWRAQTHLADGVSPETAEMLWNVIEGMTQKERSDLLEFVSGSPTLPVGGFAALSGYGGPGAMHSFTLAPGRSGGGPKNLPTAATCFNTLYLPSYSAEVEMRAALLEAVAHRAGGFSEGAVAG